jgi:hypothetical protein
MLAEDIGLLGQGKVFYYSWQGWWHSVFVIVPSVPVSPHGSDIEWFRWMSGTGNDYQAEETPSLLRGYQQTHPIVVERP